MTLNLETLLDGSEGWTEEKRECANQFTESGLGNEERVREVMKLVEPQQFYSWIRLAQSITEDSKNQGWHFISSTPRKIEQLAEYGLLHQLETILSLSLSIAAESPQTAGNFFDRALDMVKPLSKYSSLDQLESIASLGQSIGAQHTIEAWHYFNSVPDIVGQLGERGYLAQLESIASLGQSIAGVDASAAKEFFYWSADIIEQLSTSDSVNQLGTVASLGQSVAEVNARAASRFFLLLPKALREKVDLDSLADLLRGGTFIHQDDIAGLKIVINRSTWHLDRKKELITLYSATGSIFDMKGTIEDPETWIEELIPELRDTAQEKYGFCPDDTFSPMDLIELIGLELDDEYDELSAIRDVLQGSVNKMFPTDKIYAQQKAGAQVGKMATPEKAIEMLVYGLIGSRNPDNEAAAEVFFEGEEDKLKRARQYMQDSGARKRFFKEQSQAFQSFQQGNQESGMEVLGFFRELYQDADSKKIEPLSDLVTVVEAMSTGKQTHDTLILKTMGATTDDLFNNETTLCCAFHPSGANKEAAVLYLVDPSIALLQLVPQYNGTSLDPVGVAITFFAEDKDNTIYMVVDSVEGGNGLPKNWKSLFYENIVQFAGDQDCDVVLFNTEVANAKPGQFISFLEEKGLPEIRKKLKKTGETETIEEYGISEHYLECFGGWSKPKGFVQGYVVELK